MTYIAIIAAFAIGAGLGYFWQKGKIELIKSQISTQAQVKEETMNAAKAAMFEVTNQVSNKLLEDHKRENEETKKQATEITQKTTLEFEKIVHMLAEIDGQVKKQDSELGAVWQALSSPTGAGNFAEIGLENTLKNLGLEAGRDFITQYSVTHEGSRLRPDAIVFLPAGNLMVIDSKSSKFFLEIASGESDEQKILEKLKVTMNNHLSNLCSKDYGTAIKQDAGKDAGNVINVMFVPNGAALSRIFQSDQEFRQKCHKKDIILADPASLQLLLNIATHEISRARQEHNFQQILREFGKLVSSIDVFLRNAEAVGKAIRSAGENFSKLSKSVNSRLLPRVRKVMDLGVEPENNAKMPESLPDFTITENEPVTIEIGEEDTNIRKIEKKAG